MPTATFPKFFMGFSIVVTDPMNVCTVQHLKSVALPVSEIIWGTQKIRAVLDSLDMTTLPFLQNFNGL